MRIFFFYLSVSILLILVLPIVFLFEKAPEEPKKIIDNSPEIIVEMPDGSLEKNTIEEFLVGVISAEMPSSFPLEALEAQAIAARTYIYCQIGSGKHKEADICTDFHHCQAWVQLATPTISSSSFEIEKYQKITSAVKNTYGKIITYNGTPISTPYFSTCGGLTEDAENVWGNALPYLKSVPCTYCKSSPKYLTEKSFTYEEIQKKLQVSNFDLNSLIIKKDNSQRVLSLTIDKKIFSGNEVRTLLELNSTSFSFKKKDNKIVITTSGYGHGVGLCQYGSKGLALEGFSSEEIIKYYYTGVEIKKLY